MPAIAANAKNFLLHSDYPLDKVIYMTSGTLVVPALDFASQTVPHGLGFMPLIIGSWSVNADFSTSNEAGDVIYGDPAGAYLNIGSDGTNLYIFGNNNATSPKTMYWRAYGFMPSNVNVDSPLTASSADKFILNTGYNYTKLYLAGSGSVGGGGTLAVDHNLNYRPQAEVWWINPGNNRAERLAMASNNPADSDRQRVLITDTRLTMQPSATASTTTFHYRIYLDE